MDVSFLKRAIEQDQYFASFPSETFEIDFDLLSKILKDHEACEGSKSNTRLLLTPDVRRTVSENSPYYAKRSFSYDSPHRLLRKPDKSHSSQKQLNLERLLLTPKPASGSGVTDNRKGTPCVTQNIDRSSIEAMLLTTPMLMHTLDNIQMEAENTDSHTPYPDLLQFIDHEYKRSESEENNANSTLTTIIECKEARDSSTEIKQLQPVSPPRKVCRRRYRTKLMTEEERQSSERLSREKAKKNRKIRFSQTESCGTRRSKREKKACVRYSAS